MKNARLIFGHQDSPAVSQFTMLEASEVYRQYNRSMSAIEQCLVSMIKAILTFSRFADDIQTSCTQKRVEEYCKITGTSSPKAPPISETCIEQGTCTGKHEIFTLAMFESFKREFLELSRQLMIKLCETLVKILNFAGFPVLKKASAAASAAVSATATTEAAAARAEALGTGAAAAKTVQDQPLKCHQEILR